MASQVNNLGTTALIILLFAISFTMIYLLNTEVSDKNNKLDIESQELVLSLGSNYENNYEDKALFETADSNLTNDSTFEGVDPFARQYLEDKSEISQKRGTIETVLLFPSLLLVIFGVDDIAILITFSGLVIGFVTFLIGLQIYKSVRTGEVD